MSVLWLPWHVGVGSREGGKRSTFLLGIGLVRRQPEGLPFRIREAKPPTASNQSLQPTASRRTT